jgi:hypothetical protein
MTISWNIVQQKGSDVLCLRKHENSAVAPTRGKAEIESKAQLIPQERIATKNVHHGPMESNYAVHCKILCYQKKKAQEKPTWNDFLAPPHVAYSSSTVGLPSLAQLPREYLIDKQVIVR